MMNSLHNPVTEFYDKLSVDYDVMTGFGKRLTREEGTSIDSGSPVLWMRAAARGFIRVCLHASVLK